MPLNVARLRCAPVTYHLFSAMSAASVIGVSHTTPRPGCTDIGYVQSGLSGS